MNKNALPDIADPARPLSMLAVCPAHATTPLTALPDLAHELGWASLHAKDERGRMGLGSFKALGGAYAVAHLVHETLHAALEQAPKLQELASCRDHPALGGLTVCCASAGNHGLSVAAGAKVFGIACEVVLARSVPEDFANRLREKGATVIRAGEVYDDAMAAALERAKRPGCTLVSDMATTSDMHLPSMVMQGYSVMADEIATEFERLDAYPDVVALQAGVGGIAASVAAHIRRTWPTQPRIVVVEPDRAACLKTSVEVGELTRADGPISAMGRLDCKEASVRAFDVLREAADEFVTVSEEEVVSAADRLAKHGLATSPSGAAGFAGMLRHATRGERVLVLVTEGPID